MTLQNKSLLLFCLILTIVNRVELQNQYCTPVSQNIGPNDFPKLPEEFQTRVEINLNDQKRSMEVLLLYDRYDKSGEITFREKNDRFIQRFKFRENEMFTIRDDQCQVNKINETSNDNLFFGFDKDNTEISVE